ncbi:hypothetical protein [Xanthomonas phage Suba]|uniref:Uncharacterized protein n=1 Tax=Xanthomonas phage Suba TaxID=2674975 RepID=A0A679KKG8_9CAUD|nr:hypothetical protein QAY88_gp08 [Xanthomonas phage Suba]CAA2409745.1 hypothetical protein [Xanthomonas phage Suba]
MLNVAFIWNKANPYFMANFRNNFIEIVINRFYATDEIDKLPILLN